MRSSKEKGVKTKKMAPNESDQAKRETKYIQLNSVRQSIHHFPSSCWTLSVTARAIDLLNQCKPTVSHCSSFRPSSRGFISDHHQIVQMSLCAARIRRWYSTWDTCFPHVSNGQRNLSVHTSYVQPSMHKHNQLLLGYPLRELKHHFEILYIVPRSHGARDSQRRLSSD